MHLLFYSTKNHCHRKIGWGWREGAAWIWREDLCVRLSVRVLDSKAASWILSIIPSLVSNPPVLWSASCWPLMGLTKFLFLASLHPFLLGLLPSVGHRLGTSTIGVELGCWKKCLKFFHWSNLPEYSRLMGSRYCRWPQRSSRPDVFTGHVCVSHLNCSEPFVLQNSWYFLGHIGYCRHSFTHSV